MLRIFRPVLYFMLKSDVTNDCIDSFTIFWAKAGLTLSFSMESEDPKLRVLTNP
jgi:hypothetical protein